MLRDPTRLKRILVASALFFVLQGIFLPWHQERQITVISLMAALLVSLAFGTAMTWLLPKRTSGTNENKEQCID